MNLWTARIPAITAIPTEALSVPAWPPLWKICRKRRKFSRGNFEEKLDKYAEIIVKIGANVQKAQKVWINCTTNSLPLVYKIVEKAYEIGASDVNVKLGDDKLTRLHAEYKSEEIYSTIPKWAVDERNYYLDNNVVFIHILGSSPKLLEGIDPKKLGAFAKNMGEAFKYYRSRVY